MAQRFDSEDDYNPLGEHVVEIPARDQALHPAPRRSYATVGVAAFLALVGIGITAGLISDQSRRAKDEAVQREELRVGWQMLGTLAANGAARDANAATAQPAQPTQPQQTAAPSVVVVNVPAPGLAQAPAASAAAQATQLPNPAPNGTLAMQAVPGAGVIVQPPFVAGIPALNRDQLSPTATQASPTLQSLPSGSVAASPPAQSLPIGGVPATDGLTFPASQMCGLATCNTGSVCCNPSCGICTEPGATCSQQAC